MKNVFFFILMIALRFSAMADTVPTYRDSTGGYYFCKIVPVNCMIGKDTAKRLSVTLYADNIIDYAQVSFTLRDNNGIPQCGDNIVITGTAYSDYKSICESDTDARISFIYEYVSRQIPGITIIY